MRFQKENVPMEIHHELMLNYREGRITKKNNQGNLSGGSRWSCSWTSSQPHRRTSADSAPASSRKADTKAAPSIAW
jgi:hypothetical protein